jgi:serine/threonine protein kinase
MIGKAVSHYRIVEKLGEGGMGVVYKAEDLKLGRAVALKFLLSHLLESEEHKARFLHEARAAALLDHPNICTVYEIDEVDGRALLAMAFLECQTLKQKIAARPLPLSEALDIAWQIGQGLQAAHEKNIVHRDIKPANIMITPQGQVKIMDFGLAQLSDRTKLTASGMKLGTPAYMSPEQTEGRPTDRRSDLWSLGCVQTHAARAWNWDQLGPKPGRMVL